MAIGKQVLKGKSAVVTGSTSGIGLGIAIALARSGCNLTINGFGDARQIQDIRNSLAEEHDVSVYYSNADMLEPGQIETMIKQARDNFGSLDILVNNAGIQFVSPVDSLPTEKWDAIIGINLSAAFHTTRLAVPMMVQSGWGRIINIASAHALVASPFKSAYVAAKHGLAGLTKSVALEVAEKGITVNAIAPGYVETPLVRGQIADTAQARGISEEEVVRDVMLAAQPTKKMVTIEQVANLAAYLCGDSASGITGSILPIDGGWTAR